MCEKSNKFKGTYFVSSISIFSAICEFGISSIFVLFLIYIMHFSMPLTSRTFAYYYSFANLLPILIGYISDKYLKKKISLSLGFIALIVSQFILSFASSLYTPGTFEYNSYPFNAQTMSYFCGLFFLALGTSFTGLSFSSIINSLNKKENRLEAFSIYYSILNMGVLIGVILMTIIIGEDNYTMYGFGFLLIGIILIIGFISFLLFGRKYLVDNDGNTFNDKSSSNLIKKCRKVIFKRITSKNLSNVQNLSFMQRFKLLCTSLSSVQKDRIKVFLVCLLIIIVYRIAYTQSNISMVFFIDNYVEREFSFYTIPVQMFFILNPLFILVLGPVYIKFNKKIEDSNIDLDFIRRTVIALVVLSVCYSILSVIGYYLDIGQITTINLIWMVIFEFLIAISELFLSISGYSMVGDLFPEEYYALFLGLFLATRAISFFVSGKLSELFPRDSTPNFFMNIPVDGLLGYFIIFVIINLIAAIFLIMLRNRLKMKMHLDELN